MEDQRGGPLWAAGKRLARRVFVDAWYSPGNILTSSRGLVHIARHMLDELQHGTTSIVHASDRIAERVGQEEQLPSPD